ncbi:MAG: hypothetical protein IKU32_04385 [Clostridia bacterium]|nr:hypothetical protein [Clostridia bacterium]
MKAPWKKYMICTAALLIAAFICMGIANAIQTGGGSIELSEGVLESEYGSLAFKLYRPVKATAERPAPAVLLLHGYQNDRETGSAYAIELARRGAVVLALDEYGHGASEPGMKERGYVNHQVKVNYGLESEAEGTYVTIGGPSRFRIMMNFSNLSFFDPYYSTDEEGNSIRDSSMGGIAAYAYLAGLDFVDETRMGVSGHSMGTWASWSVAAAYGAEDGEESIAPKAVVLQCGELFTDDVYDSNAIKFNNVLLLQAKYEEFSYFRDYKNMVTDELLSTPLRSGFLGCDPAEAAWNTTFGDFSDGSARRIELLNTNHRLTTHNSKGISVAMGWFMDALAMDGLTSDVSNVYMTKERLVFAAMLLCVAALLPFMELLLQTPFFRPVAQELPVREVKTGKAWWKGAVITMLTAGLTYPFLTQLGHGLLPLPEGVFRMTIGNGFLCWYLFLIIIMLVTTIVSRKRARKRGKSIGYAELGLARNNHGDGLDWGLLGKSALLSLCMAGLLYVCTILFETLFMLDLRCIWPFFKGFTGDRALQFLVYIPVFALFFLLNNSKIFAQMQVAGTETPGLKGFVTCWWKYALCMVGGVMLIALIEYIPFFMGIGPGADLLFSSTFGGPFMSLLIVFIPQVLVFSVLCTYCYRRTGSVYTGAFTVATLACWIVTGGSAML